MRKIKNHSVSTSIALASVLCAGVQIVTAESSDSRGSFFLGGSVGFNISAHFSKLGGFPAQVNTGPATGQADRFYENGFNLSQNEGFADTKTWKWGYNSASQRDAANDTISFASHTAAPVLSQTDVEANTDAGFELGYLKAIHSDKRYSWGFLGSFSYLRIEVEDQSVLVGDATLQTDVFSTAGLGGFFPFPPYNGIEEDTTHSTRIENVPASRTFTTIPGGVVAMGFREINADIFSLKFGPYLEIPITERFSASVKTGLVLGLGSSEFSYQESNTIAAIGTAVQPGITTTQNFAASDNTSVFLPGGFTGIQLNFDVSNQWRIFAGAQLQYLKSLEQDVNGREAQINLGRAFLVEAGVGYSF